MSRYSCILFDFDGLILDTEISAFQSWQEIYQEHHCSLPLEKWAARIGGSAQLFDAVQYLESLVDRPLNHKDLKARRLQRHIEMISTQSALPGVEAYIADAKRLGLKLGLASSSSRQWVLEHLTRLGLHTHFDHIQCGDEVTHKKPDPELYLSVLRALHTPAHQAIALEDSPNGVLAAQRAGIFCVAIPNIVTGQLPLDHANLRLNSLAELPLEALITEVENRQQRTNATNIKNGAS